MAYLARLRPGRLRRGVVGSNGWSENAESWHSFLARVEWRGILTIARTYFENKMKGIT